MEKRILDEATKRALQGYTPFSTTAFVDFTPEQFSDLPANVRPKFRIRSLTQNEKQQIAAIYADAGEKPDWGALAEKLVPIFSGCIISWSDYFDSGSGEEIVFSEQAKKELPSWIVTEINEFVRKISTLIPIEKLSLKSPQPSAQV